MGAAVVAGVPVDRAGSDGAAAAPFGSELSPRALRAAGAGPYRAGPPIITIG